MTAVVNGRFLAEPQSGVQRAAAGFARALTEHAALVLAAPTGHEPPWWHGEVRRAPLPPGRPGRLLWEQVALPALARGRPVVSLANTAPLLARDAVLVYDVAFLAHPEWFRPSFRRTYGAVTVRAARGAGTLVTTSAFSADEIADRLGVDRRRIEVVAPGVDERFRPPTADAVEAVRRRLDLPARFVVVVGSLDPRKNLERAAAAAAAADVPVLGVGARPEAFRGAAPPHRLRWLGRLDDAELVAVYGAATLLAYPSRYEGFGLPPLEAMACGTPVVAADIPALRANLAGAALLAPPEDAAAWADAVGRLAADRSLAAELAAAGIERAARFTWAAAGRDLAAALAAAGVT